MSLEKYTSQDEGYMRGYQVLETLSSGIHVVKRRWGFGAGRPVVASADGHKFVKKLVPEFDIQIFCNIDDVLKQVRVGKLEDVPFRTFITAPYPFQDVRDRMIIRQKWLTIALEFPVEEVFGATNFMSLGEVPVDFKLSKDDWRKLDDKKRKLGPEYKKVKKLWRESFKQK